MLKTELRTVLRVYDQIPEKLVHIRLENIPEVDRIINLSKYKHEIL